MICFRYILIITLFFVANASYSQLLRPRYNECWELETTIEEESFRYVIDESPPEPITINLNNDKKFKLSISDIDNLPAWLEIIELNESSITVNAKPIESKGEKHYKIAVIAKLAENCYDTLSQISIYYYVTDYKQFEFFNRFEFGYINNNITYSVKSIQGDENYDLRNHTGYLIGLDFVEIRAPQGLQDFGISMGVVFRQTGLTGIINGLSSGVESSTDISLRFKGELAFQFISKSMDDISLNSYLTLPAMSYSYLGAKTAPTVNNDKIKLVISYGMGLKYMISNSIGLEARIMANEFESTNSLKKAGDKISFDAVRSEFVISINNLYHIAYDFFSF